MFNNISSNYFWRFPPRNTLLFYVFFYFLLFVSMCIWYSYHPDPDTFFVCFSTEKVMDVESGQLFIDDVSLVAWFFTLFYIPALLNSNLIFSAEKLNWNRKSDKVSRFFGYQMSKLTYQKMIILMIIQRQPIFDAIISCERKGMKREDEMICVLCGFVFSHNSSGSQVATETL